MATASPSNQVEGSVPLGLHRPAGATLLEAISPPSKSFFL